MKRLLLCGAALALLLPAAPASAAKKLKPCADLGIDHVADIQKRKLRCNNARIVVRSYESHLVQCQPHREQTVAPFRECVITPVLSTGERNFFCRSAWEDPGETKRWWTVTCKSGFKDVVKWRRDGAGIAT